MPMCNRKSIDKCSQMKGKSFQILLIVLIERNGENDSEVYGQLCFWIE